MKTTNKILLFAFLAVIAGLIAVLFYVRAHVSFDAIAGSGNVIGQYKDVNDFSKVSLRGGLKAYLVQDSVDLLFVEADDNIMEYIVYDSEDGLLTVSLEAPISSQSTAKVFIHFDTLDELRTSGGVEVYSEKPLTGDFFSHRLQAGAQSTLHLQFDKVHLRAQAGAIANLSGSADTLTLYSAAGAVVNAMDFIVGYCDLEAKAGSINRLNVYGTLTGSATHGAVVDYSGNPEHMDLDIRSGVHVERRVNDDANDWIK